MKGSFNYNFYITAATVIPVLYLALTLQSSTNFEGSSFTGLIKRWKRSEADDSGRWYLVQPRKFIIALIAVGGSLAIIWSMINEFYCFYALYEQKSHPLMNLLVLISIGCLLVVIIAGPFLVFLGTWVKTNVDSTRSHLRRLTHKSS